MAAARKFLGALGSALWTGAFAIVLTAAASAVWSGLFLANIKLSPALPWSVGAMGLALVALWTFLNGDWGPQRSRQARRTLLRARSLPFGVFVVALAAGLLSLVSLSGFWIVLVQVARMPGNASNFSSLPTVTLVSALAMAALSGALTEEAGFRGYFQGTLERYLPAPLAIFAAALLMVPEHASTQGFVWPTILFYLVVDTMLGLMAYFTRSISPGVLVHAAGLAMFFGFIWPHDKMRGSVWANGADAWFFIHAGQAVLFGLFAVLAFRRLASMTRGAPDKQSTLSASRASQAI
jgi:membrane protease YdiL (CAAX protease family)